MSRTVDQRVVEMRFDNAQFASGIADTQKSLDNLNQSISNAGKNDGINNLGDGVETVKLKFSALDTIASTALANITTSVMGLGTKIVKELTLDPIMSGFSEYETKMGSIQTILSNTASKGTTLDDVNNALNTLNTYADKTIYNFAEMTRNIGTFTAAGIDLGTATTDIQGISNLAAASGSTAQQASTAMYQLSQAIAAGSVNLQDWNSVVNAGMGGEKFQEALKTTAREHGIAVDEMIEAEGSFRESLKDGWITTDVLNDTLNKFTVDGAKKYSQAMMESGKWTQEQADALVAEAQSMEDAATKVKTFSQLWDTLKEAAQSGWTTTWEILIGNFTEAEDLLTKVNDTVSVFINNSSEARNSMLQMWKDMGGRQDIIDSVSLIFDSINNLANETISAIDKTFGSLTTTDKANILKDLSTSLKTVASDINTWVTSGGGHKLGVLLTDIISPLKIVESLIKGVGKVLGTLLKEISGLGDAVQGSYKVIDFIQSFTTNIWTFSSSAADAIDKFADIVSTAIEFVFDHFDELETKISDFSNKFISCVKTWYGEMTWLQDFVGNVYTRIMFWYDQAIFYFNSAESKVSEWLQPYLDLIKGWTNGTVDIEKSAQDLGDSMNKALYQTEPVYTVLGWRDQLLNFIELWKNKIVDWAATSNIAIVGWARTTIQSIKDYMSTMNGMDSLMDSLKEKSSAVWATISKYLTIENVIGVISAAFQGIASVYTAIADAVSKTALPGIFEEQKQKILDSWNGLIASVTGGTWLDTLESYWDRICGWFKSAGAAIKGFAESISKDDVIKLLDVTTKGTLAYSIFTFVKTFKSTFDSAKKLFDNLDKIPATLKDLVAVLKGGQKDLDARVLMKIALSVAILAGSLFMLAKLDKESLKNASIAIGVIMASLTLATVTIAKLGKDSKGTNATKNIVVLCAGILLIADAMTKMAGLSWEDLARGLVGIGAIFAGILIFVNMMKGVDDKSMRKSASSLVILGLALQYMGSTLHTIGQMSWEELYKGLLGVSLLLAGMIAFCWVIAGHEGQYIKAATSTVILAAALQLLYLAVKKFGSMDFGQMMQGLLGVGLCLAEITIAIRAMPENTAAIANGISAVAFSMKSLAKAVSIFGEMDMGVLIQGLLGMAAALFIIAGAVITMQGSEGGAKATIIAAAALMMLGLTIAFLGTLKIETLVQGIISLAVVLGVLGLAATLIPKAAFLILAACLKDIGIGALAAGIGLQFFAAGIATLGAIGPDMARRATAAMNTMLAGFVQIIPLMVQKFAEGIVSAAQVILEGAPVIANAAFAIITSLLTLIVNSAAAFADAFFNIIIVVLQSLVAHTPIICDQIGQFLLAILAKIAEYVPQFIQAGADIIIAMITGLSSAIPQIVEAAITGMISMLNALTASIKDHEQEMADAMRGLMAAMIDAGIAILTGSENDYGERGMALAGSIASGIVSNAWKILEAIGSGIQSGLDWLGTKVTDFVTAGENIVGGVVDGIWNAASNIGTALVKACEDAWADFKNWWDMHSPSKRAAGGGENVSLGIAVGVRNKAKSFRDALVESSVMAMKAFSNTISNSETLADGLGIGDPVITPVLDLSNIQNGVDSISGMFGSESIALASNVSSSSVGVPSVATTIQDAVDSAVSGMMETLSNSDNRSAVIVNVPLELDGKQIAKGTATYTRDELNKLDSIQAMISGKAQT